MAHIPVLLKEVVDGLKIKSGDSVLDATFGGGGHAREIAKIIGKSGHLTALDADSAAAGRVPQECGELCSFELAIGNFRNLDKILADRGVGKLNAALFDLGLSSFQLEESGRGFSFQKDEPLRMTFKSDPNEGELTADEIVNSWDESNLADIIYGYGGEQFARRIAKSIVMARSIAPIKSTRELVDIIEGAVPSFYKKKRIHFATKTFQALRIAVNDEMAALREALEKIWPFLTSGGPARPPGAGGRLAVISFHELEDRIVKRFFKDKKASGLALILTKKPITAGKDELVANQRSHSAKLRIIEKV